MKQKTDQNQSEDFHFLAQVVMKHYGELTAAEKLRLMNIFSRVLPTEEAEAAGQTAFMLQKLEQAQLKFQELLKK